MGIYLLVFVIGYISLLQEEMKECLKMDVSWLFTLYI